MWKLTLESELDFLVYREGSGGSFEIFDIAVGTERGVGKGRRLISMLREKTESALVYAFTRESNVIAQQFYEKVGFTLRGRLSGFYGEETALLYAREGTE